jgi:hypothetical protein
MTTTVIELYDALKKAGVDDQTAKAAAQAVLPADDRDRLVTKADLTTAIAELKADLTWRIVLAMGAQVAIFSAIVGALKFVR